MSSRSRRSSDTDESTDQLVSEELAEQHDHETSIEQSCGGRTAHIVVDGDPLCYNQLGDTTPIDGDLPSKGICNTCQKRLYQTEVATVDEVNALLPDSADIDNPTDEITTVMTDGGPSRDDTSEFVSNPNTGTLHRGTRDGGVQCGSSCKSWATVDAPNPLAAVVNYGTPPCSRCFDHAYRLNRVFVKLHTATVIRKDMDELTATLPWSVDDDETAQQEDHAHAD